MLYTTKQVLRSRQYYYDCSVVFSYSVFYDVTIDICQQLYDLTFTTTFIKSSKPDNLKNSTPSLLHTNRLMPNIADIRTNIHTSIVRLQHNVQCSKQLARVTVGSIIDVMCKARSL